MAENRLTPEEFKVGDIVRPSTGFTHYTILEIKENHVGRLAAKIDPAYPDYYADLADMVLVKRG